MALEIRPYREEETEAFYRVPSIVFGNYTGKPRDPERAEFIAPAGVDPMRLRRRRTRDDVWRLPVQTAVERWRHARGRRDGRRHAAAVPAPRAPAQDHGVRLQAPVRRAAGAAGHPARVHRRDLPTVRVRLRLDGGALQYRPALGELRADAAARDGHLARGAKDQQPLLQEMYDEFIAPRNGFLRRAQPMWDLQVYTGQTYDGIPAGPSLLAVYEERRRTAGLRRLGGEVGARIALRWWWPGTAHLCAGLRLQDAIRVSGDVGVPQELRPGDAHRLRRGADRRSGVSRHDGSARAERAAS